MPETLFGWIVLYSLLALSAFLAGIINSLAGGGTLLTFPALTAVLPEVQANATSTVALMPGSAAGSYALRRELREVAGWLRVLALPSLLGGVVGALLVTRLPDGYFKALVPWLILVAALLFLVQPFVSRSLAVQDRPEGPPSWLVGGVTLFQLGVGIYGGYFGAGIGILMLASLGLMGIGDIVRINALKTFLAMLINAASVVVFIAEERVVWHLALVMALAAIAGGFLGGKAGRVLNKTFLRWFVVAIGLVVAGYYFIQKG